MASFADTYGTSARPTAPQAPKLAPVEVGPMVGWLKRLVGRSPLAELRVIGREAGPRKITDHYPTTDDGLRRMATDARKATVRAEGVYFLLNVLPDDLLTPAKAGDVVRRQWLFIDVDPTRPAETSSTDEEKQHAWIVIHSVREELRARGLEPDVFVDSGNGYHLYYPIDLPAEDGGIVERIVKGLAKRFDTEAAHVDTTVFDAPRVAKIPGTLARKGESTPDRPHRCSYVLECYPAGVPIPAADLAALADNLNPRPAPTPAPSKREEVNAFLREMKDAPAPEEWTAERRAVKYLASVPGAVAGQKGHGQTLKTACNVGPGFGLDPEAAYAILAEHYNPKCDPPWSEKDLRRKVEQAYIKETRRGYLLDAATPTQEPAAAAPPAKTKAKAKPQGPTIADPTTGVIETYDDERRLARLYVERHHAHPDRPGIVYWKGDAYVWEGGAWRIIDAVELKARLTASTKDEFDAIARETRTPVEHVDRALIGNVENMLRAMCSLKWEQALIEQPDWLGVPGPAPLECLNTRNGILHIPSFIESGRSALLPQTPNFFTPHVLDYGFDPDAPAPSAWLEFLESIFPGDEESKLALQQWFGYLLTPDTRHHAVLLMVGPPRCGKGTILRLIRRLIGEHNCVAPQLGNLGAHFGSECLIGKSLAYFGETRLGGRADPQTIVERILSISGEDQQTIPRKGIRDWTGRLTTRFVLLANDLPSLGDRSGALMSRLRVLRIRQSFVGREDRTLGDRLAAEIPSILLWALRGWDHLRRTGTLIQPAAGQEARDEMAEITNPIIPFVREHVVIGRNERETRERLYERWQDWCRANGRDRVGSLQTFISSFRSHLEASKIPFDESRFREDDGGRPRGITGIGLRPFGPNGSPY